MPKELNKPLLQKVIAELISIRKAKGIKQEDVCFDIGVHIGRIESGNFDLTLTTLKKLTDYYETDLASFFKKIKQ
ncbi:MAG: helix-turn-helix domain-containing protein [Bacteroidetes bacterium]|nr:helix-turn-helix domain-containing protein [Bacteroidota bacterium]